MQRPFIMVAPNGAHRGKTDHPALPVTIAETVATAAACHKAGADALHLHVRNADGGHSLDAGRYREALSEMARRVPAMRVQITTEAAGIYDVPDQLTCLESVRPDWASVSVREIMRRPDLADRVYGTCADQGTEVQHILYDTADVALLADLRGRGVIRAHQDSVIVVLGRYSAGQSPSPADLAAYLEAMPDIKRWMLCAFGAGEHACLVAAARSGGNLRVGFENSLIAPDGSLHPDNAASVAALVSLLERKAA